VRLVNKLWRSNKDLRAHQTSLGEDETLADAGELAADGVACEASVQAEPSENAAD
jgi:hypothetical protein